jgi:putative transposase
MRRNKIAVFVHLVWATWDRLPLITPAIERPLCRCLEKESQALGCRVLAINGMPDYVHLVATLPATLPVADLAKQAKGATSRFVNDSLRPENLFKWQGDYGAFSISPWDVARALHYVRSQKEHHLCGEVEAEWEQTFEEVEINDRQSS